MLKLIMNLENRIRTQDSAPGVGLEPCNYIRGFILLEYTKRFNEFLDVLKHFLNYYYRISMEVMGFEPITAVHRIIRYNIRYRKRFEVL